MSGIWSKPRFSVFLKLYQHSVEDTIKSNITIGGQEWNDAIPEVSSNSVIREGKNIVETSFTVNNKNENFI